MCIAKLLESAIWRNLFKQVLLGWTVSSRKEVLESRALGGFKCRVCLGDFSLLFDTIAFMPPLFSAFSTTKAGSDGFCSEFSFDFH